MILLLYAYIADLILGDPEWFPHPVRGMGRLIRFLDDKLRGKRNKRIERIKGLGLAFMVVGLSVWLAYLFVELSKKASPFLGNVAWVYLSYTTLSIKDLRIKSKNILAALEKYSIIQAQRQLSKIVGRDTQNLGKDKILTATVESIAESTNDGIIAPLFYLILGGPVLAIGYKAINTLDSMVGYKNEKYADFGWFSARLDDVVNFVPARASGFLISLAAFVLGKGFKYPFKIMLRDSRKHPSPNSGLPEAAMAGALEIRLGGDNFYQGQLSKRSFMGESKKKVTNEIVNEALTISFVSSLLMLLLGIIFRCPI